MTGRGLLVLMSLLVALAVIAPVPATAKRGGTDRPLQGSGSATALVDVATGVSSNQGTARLSHLGKTTFSLDFLVTLIGPPTNLIEGTGTFVAANGDALFVSFTGTSELSPSGASDETLAFTITGGTGRFADASGTFTVRNHSEPVSIAGTLLTLQQTFTLEGRISY
jgi:hypothetical protein